MSLAAGIFDFLSNALSVGERVYPMTLPQGVAVPAVTYQRVSDDMLVTHDIAQDHPLYDGRHHKETRVQFNAYGDTYDDAEALSNELQAVITGYRGLWGDVPIESVRLALGLDDYEPEIGKYRFISDFYIEWIGSPNGS